MHNLGKVFGPHMDILEKIITTRGRNYITVRWGDFCRPTRQRGLPTKTFEDCHIRNLKFNYITKEMLTLGIKNILVYPVWLKLPY